jgi:hypothetical protein
LAKRAEKKDGKKVWRKSKQTDSDLWWLGRRTDEAGCGGVQSVRSADGMGKDCLNKLKTSDRDAVMD